jgi:hypothetical protein
MVDGGPREASGGQARVAGAIASALVPESIVGASVNRGVGDATTGGALNDLAKRIASQIEQV